VTARQDVEGVYAKAGELLDAREPIYGSSSWREAGFNVCFSSITRKAAGLKVQNEKGHTGTDRFKEDLLDLMNWCAFSYLHLEEEKNETST